MENALINIICTACKINLWEWDIKTNTFIDEGYFGPLAKYYFDSKGTLQDFLNIIYHLDRVEVENAFNQHLIHQMPLKIEFRISRNQSLKWVCFQSHILPNGNKAVGIIIDSELYKTNIKVDNLDSMDFIHVENLNFLNEFVSSITHELNQYLMIINAYLGGCINRLKENNLNDIDKNSILQIIQRVINQTEFLSQKFSTLKNKSSFENVQMFSQLKHAD